MSASSLLLGLLQLVALSAVRHSAEAVPVRHPRLVEQPEGSGTVLPSSGAVARGRGLKQAYMDGEWEVFEVLDYEGIDSAASYAEAADRKIKIIVRNHIGANGVSLKATFIRGHLWIVGNCTGLPKVKNDVNLAVMRNLFTQKTEPICQIMLNSISPSSDSFSYSTTQSRVGMTGWSWLRAEGGDALIKLESVELAGCYSLSGGGCVSLRGAQLEAEVVSFAASFALGAGGAIWADVLEDVASGETVEPRIDLRYVTFWESTATVAGDQVFFRGSLEDFTYLPTQMLEIAGGGGWQLVSTSPPPPSPPPIALPPTPGLTSLPPLFTPNPTSAGDSPDDSNGGEFREYDGEDTEHSSFFSENSEWLILGAILLGVLLMTCSVGTITLHVLIVHRLMCFKNADSADANTLMGRTMSAHGKVMRAGSAMKSRMTQMKSRMSQMKSRMSQMKSRMTQFWDDDEEGDGWVPPSNDPTNGSKKRGLAAALRGKSIRRLAAKLDQVDAQNNDGRDYKHAKTQAGGDDTTLTVAAFQAPQAEPSPESEKERAKEGTSHLPSVKAVWGPPSMGAAYATLPKPVRGLGPLEQRRQLKQQAGQDRASNDAPHGQQPPHLQDRTESKGVRWG